MIGGWRICTKAEMAYGAEQGTCDYRYAATVCGTAFTLALVGEREVQGILVIWCIVRLKERRVNVGCRSPFFGEFGNLRLRWLMGKYCYLAGRLNLSSSW